MKKFLSLALALTMALTLAACGGKTDTPPADTNDGSTRYSPLRSNTSPRDGY